MPVSEKTRKILWGRSGNRCAICKCELVKEETDSDPAAIIGDECHIISKKSNGPRNNPNCNLELDHYDNLILLCKIHHKQIDDQPTRFNVDYLKNIKEKHTKWIHESLNENSNKETNDFNSKFNGISILPRIKTGTELVHIFQNTQAFEFDNDDLENEEEMELLSGFFQELQDWGDILDEINSAGDVIRCQFYFNKEITNLEKNGFLVFGERKLKKIKFLDQVDNWKIAIINVIRESNQRIVKFDRIKTKKK